MAFNINVFFIFFVVFISSFEKLKTISNIWFVCNQWNSARERCTLAFTTVFSPMSHSLRFDWYSRHFVLRIVCSFFVLFDFPQWWNRSLLLVQVESSCLHLWLRYDTSIEFRAFMQPILYLAQCADKYKRKKTQSFAELIDSNSQVHSIASVRGCMSVHVAVLKKEWKIKPIQFIYVTMIFVVFFKSFIELSAHHPIQPLCTFNFIPKIFDDFIVDAVFVKNFCKKRNEKCRFSGKHVPTTFSLI